MANLYLFSFLNQNVTREQMTAVFDKDSRIENWRYCLPNSIFVFTTMSARELSDEIEKNFGACRHLVTRIDWDYWGRLPTGYWEDFPNLNR